MRDPAVITSSFNRFACSAAGLRASSPRTSALLPQPGGGADHGWAPLRRPNIGYQVVYSGLLGDGSSEAAVQVRLASDKRRPSDTVA